jgi:hypothetical protein
MHVLAYSQQIVDKSDEPVTFLYKLQHDSPAPIRDTRVLSESVDLRVIEL